MDCIFCKIGRGEAPSTSEFENDVVIAFRSIDPVADTHILICPKKHIGSFVEIDDADTLFEMTKAAQSLIQKYSLEGGYKIVFNGGKYLAIPHLHMHLLGGHFHNEEILHKT